MNTWSYFADPEMLGILLPCVVAGLASAFLCALLSVFVVIKRLAFVGQGISHAAFGGIGVAALVASFLGAAGGTALGSAMGTGAGVSLAQYAIVFVFCLAAALMVSVLARKGGVEADTAIGIILVASMALGSILVYVSRSTIKWESFLFGNLLEVGWLDAWIAIGITVAISCTLYVVRRPIIFWTFDENASRAWGVPARTMQILLMVMLALATVTVMKLAGVVLATAMLVLPGAIALRLSRRMSIVIVWAIVAAVVGVLGGIVASFEAGFPLGATIVCVLTVLFAIACGVERVRGNR